MKVLFYIHYFSVGGAERISADYILKLKENNIDVEALVDYHLEDSFIEKQLKNSRVKIYSIKPEYNENIVQKVLRKSGLFNYSYWKKIVKTVNPDIIHINTQLGQVPKKICKLRPIVFSFHTDVDRHLNIFGEKEKKKLDYCSKHGMSFFAISSSTKRRIEELYPSSSVFYVPNGIDINKIAVDHYDKIEYRNEIGIPSDAFVLGHVGRFHKVKNHEKIISVFKSVLSINPNSYLVLIGTGDENETKLVNDYIDHYNVRNNVVLLGSREDATSIMGIFDAFILPSKIEGFPLVAIEAQSLKLRCVFSTGVPEDVVCSENAFRLDLDKSDEEWARLILADTKNTNYGDINKFDINYIIKEIINDYNEVLSKKR